MKKIVLSAVSMFTLMACGPKPESRHFGEPKTSFKPNHEDVDLRQIYKNQNVAKFQGSLEFTGGYNNGTLYRFSENVYILGKNLERPGLMSLGMKTRDQLQSSAEKNTIAAEKSTYVDFLISASKAPVKEALTQIDQDLKIGQDDIVKMVQEFNEKFSTSAANPVDVLSGIAYVKDYLQQLDKKIANRNVMPELKVGLREELQTQMKRLDTLGGRVQVVLAEGSTFPQMLSNLFSLLEQEKIALPADIQPLIDQAKELGQGLVSCQTPQEAMTVIIDVWLLLAPEDRETYFKEVSEELYGELKKSGKKSLACLRDEDCKGFFRKLKKNLFILPAIKKFGPEKICQEIDINAQKFVRDLLQTEITKVLVSTPQTLPSEVELAITKKRDDLKSITGDYSNFFKTRFAAWAQSQNMKSIVVKTGGRQEISLSGNQLKMKEIEATDSDMFESFGPGIAASVLKSNLKSGFEMLSRITSISDIVLGDKDVEGEPISKKFRNMNQAETLRGLSQAIRYFRDWEVSEFDQSLGKIMAQDLIPDMDLGANNQALFPKADLYALTIAASAQFITNIQSDNSPLFTMGVDKNIHWLDEKISDQDKEKENRPPQVLAAIVEIKEGQKAGIVKTSHLARWIIAAAEFLSAIEGAENSSSVDLKKLDENGKPNLDKIIESRQTLRQLILGMSNFLSTQMLDDRGLYAASYDIKTGKQSPAGEVSVLDQALSIRALLAASDALGAETYRFSAIDNYYKMNQNLFSPKMRFYQVSKTDANPQLPVVVEILRALNGLEPYLPAESAEQLRWIMEPWVSGLENIQL